MTRKHSLNKLPEEMPLLAMELADVTETEHWSIAQNHLTFHGTHYPNPFSDEELLELWEVLTAWKEKRDANKR